MDAVFFAGTLRDNDFLEANVDVFSNNKFFLFTTNELFLILIKHATHTDWLSTDICGIQNFKAAIIVSNFVAV